MPRSTLLCALASTLALAAPVQAQQAGTSILNRGTLEGFKPEIKSPCGGLWDGDISLGLKPPHDKNSWNDGNECFTAEVVTTSKGYKASSDAMLEDECIESGTYEGQNGIQNYAKGDYRYTTSNEAECVGITKGPKGDEAASGAIKVFMHTAVRLEVEAGGMAMHAVDLELKSACNLAGHLTDRESVAATSSGTTEGSYSVTVTVNGENGGASLPVEIPLSNLAYIHNDAAGELTFVHRRADHIYYKSDLLAAAHARADGLLFWSASAVADGYAHVWSDFTLSDMTGNCGK